MRPAVNHRDSKRPALNHRDRQLDYSYLVEDASSLLIVQSNIVFEVGGNGMSIVLVGLVKTVEVPGRIEVGGELDYI